MNFKKTAKRKQVQENPELEEQMKKNSLEETTEEELSDEELEMVTGGRE